MSTSWSTPEPMLPWAILLQAATTCQQTALEVRATHQFCKAWGRRDTTGSLEHLGGGQSPSRPWGLCLPDSQGQAVHLLCEAPAYCVLCHSNPLFKSTDIYPPRVSVALQVSSTGNICLYIYLGCRHQNPRSQFEAQPQSSWHYLHTFCDGQSKCSAGPIVSVGCSPFAWSTV